MFAPASVVIFLFLKEWLLLLMLLRKIHAENVKQRAHKEIKIKAEAEKMQLNFLE